MHREVLGMLADLGYNIWYLGSCQYIDLCETAE